MKLTRKMKLVLHLGLLAVTAVLVFASGEPKPADLSFLVLALVVELG